MPRSPAVTMHWSMMLPPSNTSDDVVQSPLIRADGNFVILVMRLIGNFFSSLFPPFINQYHNDNREDNEKEILYDENN